MGKIQAKAQRKGLRGIARLEKSLSPFKELFAGQEVLRSFIDDLKLGVGFGMGEYLMVIFGIKANVPVARIPEVEGTIHESGLVALRTNREVILADIPSEVSGLPELGGVTIFPS